MKFQLKKLTIMKTFLQTIICSCLIVFAYAQAPTIKWQHTYGGTGDDEARAIDITSDGGTIIAGYTNSTNGQVTGFHFNFDYWIVKLNSAGSIQWESAFGGSNNDVANDVHQTRDGGYIVAGFSESADGDLNGSGANGEDDFWVLKLDAGGHKQWSKLYGGWADDVAHSIQQTSDGGYIVAGESYSSNVPGHHGADDFMLVKIDSSGNVQWENSYGGSGYEFATRVLQESDGSYMVVGSESSTDGQVTGNRGSSDLWVLHLAANGNMLWQKTYGGSGLDNGYALADAGNGKFFIAAQSYSTDGQVTGNHGNGDFWILKINANGSLLWQKAYGGSDYDQPVSIAKTKDGGCFVTGMERSVNGDVTGNNGNYDFWAVKLKSNGDLMWQKSLGGNQYDEGFGGKQTSDGGFMLSGFTSSSNGEVTSYHGGIADFWVVKLNKSSGTTVFSKPESPAAALRSAPAVNAQSPPPTVPCGTAYWCRADPYWPPTTG